jgi:hypothetical protein
MAEPTKADADGLLLLLLLFRILDLLVKNDIEAGTDIDVN